MPDGSRRVAAIPAAGRLASGLILALGVSVACGSRTGLLEGGGASVEAGVVDGAAADAGHDAGDGGVDGPVEVSGPTGCISNAGCDDGIACTDDSCELDAGTCGHRTDNALCPVGFACDAMLGCVASGFVVSPGELFAVRLPSGSTRTIGPTVVSLDDIALHPNGTLYAVAEDALYAVDPSTAVATFLATESAPLNALDAAPDGTLYAAGGQDLYTLDPVTGKLTMFVQYPLSLSSSGDLAVMGSTLLATVTGPGGDGDQLLSVDLATRKATVIGATGYGCIYGLATYGATLYGFTCHGEVLGIDPATAQATLIDSTGVEFYGASER